MPKERVVHGCQMMTRLGEISDMDESQSQVRIYNYFRTFMEPYFLLTNRLLSDTLENAVTKQWSSTLDEQDSWKKTDI